MHYLHLPAVSREPSGVFDRALVRLHWCCRDSMVCLVRVLLGPDARNGHQGACRPDHLRRLAGEQDEVAAPLRRSVASQEYLLYYPGWGLRGLARDRGKLANAAVRHREESPACVLLPRSDVPTIERPAHSFLLARWIPRAPFPWSVCPPHLVRARADLQLTAENRLRACRGFLQEALTLRDHLPGLSPAVR